MARKTRVSQRNCVDEQAVPAAKSTVAPEGASHQEAAEYIAAMLEGMRLLAHQTHMPFLAYLLGIALEEANSEKIKRD